MNAAIQRIVSAALMLLITALAIYLRFYGLDWAFKDNASFSPHPDERHYQSCADVMNIRWLTEEERALPWRGQWELFYERNLEIPAPGAAPGRPGLRPVNYNYGTFPLHIYLAYRDFVASNSYQSGDRGGNWNWVFINFPGPVSWVLLGLALWISLRMLMGVWRDLRAENPGGKSKWRDEFLLFVVPCLLIPVTGLILFFNLPGEIVDYSRYHPQTASILIIGRTVTAWAGVLTVLLAYLIGRDAYNRATGVAAALMLATAMLHVQTSHFATVDVIVGFWTTAAVYCFLKLSQKPYLWWYLLGAVCAGFAAGSKWSGIILPGLLLAAHAIATWGHPKNGKLERVVHTVWLLAAGAILVHFFKAATSGEPLFHVTLANFRDFYVNNWLVIAIAAEVAAVVALIALIIRHRGSESKPGWFIPFFRVHLPWVWLVLAVAAGAGAFYFAQPMAWFDAQAFASDIAEQARINATGEAGAVFTQQFLDSIPVVTMLDNLFYPSLDWLTAFFVVAGCVYALFRLLYNPTRSDLLLAAWAVPGFLVYSSLASTFPRYIIPVLPTMIVLGARFMVDMAAIKPNLYSPAFPSVSPGAKAVFKRAATGLAAAALLSGLIYGFAYTGVYSGAHTLVDAGRIVRENMRPGARVTQNAWDEGLPGVHIESANHLHVHDANDMNVQQRVRHFVRTLENHDYIVFPSKRGYGTTLDLPERFPVTNQFLRALFAEQLGFRIAKVVENPPQFMGIKFYADAEDETARIYDHPKVVVFEKIEDLSAGQLSDLILNPPNWVREITKEEILSVRDGKPVFARTVNASVLRWWIAVQALGWLAFLILFPLCRRLPDGGYGLSKAAGIAFFAWLAWWLASNRILLLSPWQLGFVFLLMAAMAAAAAWKYRKPLAEFIGNRFPLLLGMEALYIAVWAVFLLIRMYHPAVIWGEKPMNFSFVNAVYRAETFPPEDPWISDHPVNYYYYGQAVYSIVGRFAGLPPEYAFNVGGTGVTALVAIGVFSLAHALCGRWLLSLLATWLAVFAGHWVSYRLFLENELGRTDLSWQDWIAGSGAVFKLAWTAVLGYLGFADNAAWSKLAGLNYETLFWKSGHDIFEGAAANEFPYWMHLFLDFHAHMLVIPFTLAFLALLYAYFLKPARETGGMGLVGFSFFLALFMGTVICSNTWDFPALLISLVLITAVKWFREDDVNWEKTRRGGWFNAEALQSFARFPLAPLALILAFNLILFYPFHANFEARVTGVGLMTEGQTPLSAYLGYWIHLLFPTLVGVLLLVTVRPGGSFAFGRSAAFAVFFMASAGLALWFSRTNPFDFPPPLSPTDPPLNLSVFGLLFPFLFVLFLAMWDRKADERRVFGYLIGVLGLGFSLGIELFYIKEGWAPPNHRWNTLFKFNIQIWHYLSIFAAIAMALAWNRLRGLGGALGKPLSAGARGLFATAAALLILGTLPFTLVAPVLVTQTHGARYRDARGETPTLDGLAWLRSEHYDAYAGVEWFNRFASGTPNIVEYSDKPYFEFARFSSNTGLPSLIGWDHHVGERMHLGEKGPRRQAIDRIYLSDDKEEVVGLLSRYNIEYLVFGELEMNTRRGDRDRLPPLGQASLDRFERWGDVFRLQYRLGDQSIFGIDRSLNRVYGIATGAEYRAAEPPRPPALKAPEPGVSMFDSTRGMENGLFDEPRGLVENATGEILVADTRNHRVQAFRPDGGYLWQAGDEGQGPGEFKEPNDICIDALSGKMFVADTWNHRIAVLDAYGSFKGEYAMGFFGPRGIVFHPRLRRIYMTDTGNHRVRVLSADGELIGTWGESGGGSGPGNFREPVGIDVMPNGNLIVVDSLNRRMQVFAPNGGLIREIAIQTTWDGEGGFEGHVACAADGSIYLTDPRERSVHRYNRDGGLTARITTDIRRQPFAEPVGILVTSEGRVLVTDKGANRVVEVAPPPPAVPTPVPETPAPAPAPEPPAAPTEPAPGAVEDATPAVETGTPPGGEAAGQPGPDTTPLLETPLRNLEIPSEAAGPSADLVEEAAPEADLPEPEPEAAVEPAEEPEQPAPDQIEPARDVIETAPVRPETPADTPRAATEALEAPAGDPAVDSPEAATGAAASAESATGAIEHATDAVEPVPADEVQPATPEEETGAEEEGNN